MKTSPCFILHMLGRLRSTAEFERVKREGGYWGGLRCSINAARQPAVMDELGAASERDRHGARLVRIGLITSRKIGNAVKRNRARRLMRESMRQMAAALTPDWDIVVIARSAIAAPGVRMQDVRDEIQGLLTKASLINPGMR